MSKSINSKYSISKTNRTKSNSNSSKYDVNKSISYKPNQKKNQSTKKYVRSKVTYTDKLQTTKAMQDKLKNYSRVESVDTVPLKTHIRYVTWKNGKQRFCLGGFLIEKHEEYVKLTNNSLNWCVQKKHYENDKLLWKTVFFKNKNYKSDKEIINKQKRDLNDYKKLIQKLEKENKILRQKLNIGNMRII